MATAKLVLIFPRPRDEAAFEQVYRDVHMPMIEQKLKGLHRFVATKIVSSPQGQTRTYRISEVHFSDLQTLKTSIESDPGKEVMEHAKTISTGGPPIVLVCEEESYLFW
jgi:uncharacterized protein (TIGR02118 family)